MTSGQPKSKSAQALKTISEVANVLELPQHVLRFWETKFPQIQPLKRRGGRRFYRPEDVELLQTIKVLLHEKGYTIKGAVAVLNKPGKVELVRDNRVAPTAASGSPSPSTVVAATGTDGQAVATGAPAQMPAATQEAIRSVKEELEELQGILKKVS